MEHYVNNKSFLLNGFGGKLKEGEGEDEIFSFVKEEDVVYIYNSNYYLLIRKKQKMHF